MQNRSSRPQRFLSGTSPVMVHKIVHLRWKKGYSPLQISARVGMPAATVHAVLVRVELNRLSHINVRTGEPVCRCEDEFPGSLIHVDVKKLGNTPAGADGGSCAAHRVTRTALGGLESRATHTVRRRWGPRLFTPSSTTTPVSRAPISTMTGPR